MKMFNLIEFILKIYASIILAVLLFVLLCLVVKKANADCFALDKLKEIVNSDYYNKHPDIQDHFVLELMIANCVPSDYESKYQGYAEYWGELKNSTPINHRYYKFFKNEYTYWSNEWERQIIKEKQK